MGTVTTPLCQLTVPDSNQPAANNGTNIYLPFAQSERYMIPHYADAGAGDDADTGPAVGSVRYLFSGDRFERYTQVGSTFMWVPLLPGILGYSERTTTDDTTSGGFGTAAGLTLTNPPPGKYRIYGKVTCGSITAGTVVVRLTFNGTNAGGDCRSTVGAAAYLSDSQETYQTLPAGLSTTTASLQVQHASDQLHVYPGSRVMVEWLGL